MRTSLHPFTAMAMAGLLWAWGAPARGHHVVAELGMAPVLPRTTAAVEVGAASFQTRGHSGSWQSITGVVEWSVTRWLSFFATLPLARVQLVGAQPETGPGDTALSAKVAIAATEHGGLLLSGGVGAELPTGDETRGLGGGHVEVTPFLLASSALARRGTFELVTYALLSPRFALGGHHQQAPTGAASHSHGSLLSPHGERELFGRCMAAIVRGAAHAGGGAEGASVFSGDTGGYLALRGEAGFLFAGALRAVVAVDTTVAGERRFGTRGRLALAWLF